MKLVKAVQDSDGHWYVIPNRMLAEFSRMLSENHRKEESDERYLPDIWAEFNDKFAEYQTGGDLNLVQLYIDDKGTDTRGQKARELEELRAKAEKWDALDMKIAKYYVDENGDELPDDPGGDLTDIGEAAAHAFGWL